MSALSHGVEVPASHLERRLAPVLPESDVEEPPPLRIRSSSDKPEHAFASVRYEDGWFWIAEDDWRSKSTLTSLLFLFTLARTNGAQPLPTITTPTF